MKKIIKFRACDGKHMYDEAGLTPTGRILVIELPDGIVQAGADQMNLMQFTGSSDKNGLNVFENDICRDMDNGLYVIEYDEAEFVSIHDPNVRECLSETHDQIEVIGNTFENPELFT